jgi:hypothetical protein
MAAPAELREAPKAHAVDSTKLAWWAEEAHGKQGKPLYVVVGDDGNAELTDIESPGKQLLFEVTTRPTRPPIPPPAKVLLQARQGGPEINLINDPRFEGCDALFWTVSSIEKFLFPYYAAQRLYSDAQLSNLRAKFLKDEKLVAVLHRAPSKPVLLDTTLFCAVPNDQAEPRWIPITEYLNLK